jgi:O6-methylguanine-DNA--protein-cysteine methyltransferase
MRSVVKDLPANLHGSMMSAVGFTLFETAIGHCGVAWNDRGIVGVQLPESGIRETQARLQRRFPSARESAPPPEVRAARDAIVALLAGAKTDLSAIALDMEQVPPFHRRVYEAARTIPPGGTLTYGDIAAMLRGARCRTRRRPRARAQPVRDRGAVPSSAAAGVARWAASRPTAASRQSSVCFRSKASKRVRKCRCSQIHRGGAET